MSISTGRALLDAEKILRNIGLSAGQTYVDFGSGTLGHFVIPAAGLVGENGRAIAFDVLPEVLEATAERARTEKVLNLETVWGDLMHERGTEKIPATSVDLASVVNLASLLLKSPRPLENLKRVLKKSGRLLLIDWRPDSKLAGSFFVKPISLEALKKTLAASGFNLLKSFSAGEHHFGLLFEK